MTWKKNQKFFSSTQILNLTNLLVDYIAIQKSRIFTYVLPIENKFVFTFGIFDDLHPPNMTYSRFGQQTRYKYKSKTRLKKKFLRSIEQVYITCGMENFSVLHKIDWSGAKTGNDIECDYDLVRKYSRNNLNGKVLDHVYVITIKNKCV